MLIVFSDGNYYQFSTKYYYNKQNVNNDINFITSRRESAADSSLFIDSQKGQ